MFYTVAGKNVKKIKSDIVRYDALVKSSGRNRRVKVFISDIYPLRI
jgi:hypothetical protein